MTMTKTTMIKNPNTSSSWRGFWVSLLVLIAALVLFFMVVYPHEGHDVVRDQLLVNDLPLKRLKPKNHIVKDHLAEDHLAEDPVSTRDLQAEKAKPQGGSTLGSLSGNSGNIRSTPETLNAAPNDTSHDSQLHSAMSLIDQGLVSEAVSALEDLLKSDPKNEGALIEMAMIHMMDLKQPDQAIVYLKKIFDLNPRNQMALTQLVGLYEEEGRTDEGVQFFLEASAKNPESSDAAYGAGQILVLAGRDQEAVTYLQRAVDSGGGTPRSYRDLAQAYSRLGRPDIAIENYDRSIASLEKELISESSHGLPTQYTSEQVNFTKVQLAQEHLRNGQISKAQAILDEVKGVLPGDEAIRTLQQMITESLVNSRSG